MKISFILIIVLSIFLRFFLLGQNPISLDWDEVSLAYNAYSILANGRDEYGNFLPLSIRSFNDYKPPLYTYLTTLPVYLFGLNELSARITSALSGILAVIASFFLTKKITGNFKLSLLSMLLLALSPWHLQFSRIAFEANVALSLIIIAVTLFIYGLNNKLIFMLSALFFSLSLFAYHSPRLIVPILIFGLILIYWRQLKKNLKNLIYFSTIIILFLTPILYEFSSSSGARFSSVSIINPDQKLGESIKSIDYDNERGDTFGKYFHNRRIIFAREILAGYLDHFNFDFLFLTGDPPGRHHAAGIGILYIFELPFIFLGVFYSLKNLKTNNKVLLLWFLVAPLASSLTSGTPHAVRAIFYLPIYQIFASLGIIGFLNLINSRGYANSTKFAGIIILVMLFSYNFYYYLHQYYIHTPIEYAKEWQYGYKQAVAEVGKYKHLVDKIIFTYRYDQPYVYFLFYEKTDPIWYQKNWGEGEINRSLRNFSKYEFRNIDWQNDKNLKNVLLVGTEDEIPENEKGNIPDIKFPDGKVAFRFVLR